MSIKDLAEATKEETHEAMSKVEAANRALRRNITRLKPPPVPKEWKRPDKVAAEQVAELKDMAGKKVVQATEQFTAGLPLIEKAGYRLNGLDIEIGIPPQLVPKFSIREHIGAEQQEEVLAEARGNRLVHAVLKAMFKANELQRYIKFGALEFTELAIELGTLPKVRMRFVDARESDVVREGGE